MMYCIPCGTEAHETYHYCRQCGTQLLESSQQSEDSVDRRTFLKTLSGGKTVAQLENSTPLVSLDSSSVDTGNGIVQ